MSKIQMQSNYAALKKPPQNKTTNKQTPGTPKEGIGTLNC